jgi:hypothetical protein
VTKLSFALPRTTRARIFLLLALTAFAIAALVYSPMPDYARMRPPNPHETFFQYVAFEFDAPALCEKLSPSAVIPGGIFIAPSYARSACYAKIARRYNQPALCWRAHRLGAIALIEEQVSPVACWWQVIRDAPDRRISTYMPSPTDLNSVFAAMGYHADELYRENITPPLLNPKDTYRQLAKAPDLIARIARLTTTSTAITPAQRAMLFDLAAHASGDPSWCTKIPADQLDPGAVRNAHGPSLFALDRCVLEVATNTRRPDFCRLIPERAGDFPAPMSRRSVCQQQASRPRDKYYYGANPPDSYDEATRIITMLGYPMPDVHDLPATEIASAYYYFIWQMARDNSAAASAARAKFLARVSALPGYN